MMTPPLKLLSYSSSHQVCMCHGLNLWVNFSKIKNNILYFQNPLVNLFLYIVYCCNSSTSKIKNSTLFHYRYRPPGTVSEVCGGAEGQCLAPGYDLPGARSRPQGRGADLKGPDSKGTLGVLTELSSGSLLHASATGHSRKVRVINIMCFWSICYGICLLYLWFILPCNSLEKIGGGENWKQKLFWFNLRSNSLILLSGWNLYLIILCILYIFCRLSHAGDDLDPQFRLWLSSKPDSSFPISILQTGMKVSS